MTDDARLEAAAGALTSRTLAHVWVIGENRCMCGLIGTYAEMEHHHRIEQVRPILAAVDALGVVS